MVSTRGRFSGESCTVSEATSLDDTSVPTTSTADSRRRKRRRSRSSIPATTKSQSIPASSSIPPEHESSSNKPYKTRQRPITAMSDIVQRSIQTPSIPATPETFLSTPAPQTTSSAVDSDSSTLMTDLGPFAGLTNVNYASQGYDEMGMVNTSSFLPQGASLHVKIQSLPVLDNLATQILNILAKSSYQEVINMTIKQHSEPGKAFETLKTLFNHAKKVYSQNEPFLNPYQLGLSDNAHTDTIKKANMATFVISVFGSQDVGFYHLNEHFLTTFVADGHQLLKTPAELLLELKTQAYISAASNGGRSRDRILEDLFPHDLEKQLLERRPDAKQLSPSEKDFVQRAQNRRKVLFEEPDTEEAIKALPEKYIWADFLRDISTYVAKNFDTIANEPARKTSRSQRVSNQTRTNQRQQVQSGFVSNSISPYQNPGDFNFEDDFAGKAQRAVQAVMQDYGSHQTSNASPNAAVDLTRQNPNTRATNAQLETIPTKQPEIQFHFENQLHPNVPGPQFPYFNNIPYQNGHIHGQWHPGTPSDPNYVPYPTQSAPTSVLYERARMAATSKASPSLRKPGHPSQRRPWTLEEETALMAGLDRVKGPHWSQILAMFGPGGTISEVLKDRGQVQLKDKARNLKLFFLKSGIEVPYYLQFVTGELKTRAPAQAAKNEAKRKRISEEDRAHVEGIMALASGPQQIVESSGPRTDANGQPNDLTARNGFISNDNVDPSLHAIAREGQNHLGSQASGSVAPSADMLSGRQNIPQDQFQQDNQQMQPTQQTGAEFSFGPGLQDEGVSSTDQ